MNAWKKGLKNAGLLAVCLVLLGCTQTYPADQVKESIQEICRKEYGIEKIDVKIAGRTLGVYLPLKKLFAADFKEGLLSGKFNGDLESLFQPSPEALDQVEDVLFSISRVLLSTDLKIQFYVLQATDIEKTGLQLVLIGHSDDIRRVRLWDISRNEYRKRVLHEIRLNRAVIWDRPVVAFFKTLETAASSESLQPYFTRPMSPELLDSLFMMKLNAPGNKSARWQLGELKSTLLEPTRALVHVPVTLEYGPAQAASHTFKVPSGTFLEYFMIVSLATDPPQIVRVIPLSYLDETGHLAKIGAPEEFGIYTDHEEWQTEFPLTEIHLGDFLAEQLSRRTQALLAGDERIRNTFEEVRMTYHYKQEPPKKYFSWELEVKPKSPAPRLLGPSVLDDDVLYLLNLASHEFVDLIRSYQFSDYSFLEVDLASDPVSRLLGLEDLELLRRNKAELKGLLGGVSPV